MGLMVGVRERCVPNGGGEGEMCAYWWGGGEMCAYWWR